MTWIYYGTLPSIEDSNRYTAPPDSKDDRWEEPEDHMDYIETLNNEPEQIDQ